MRLWAILFLLLSVACVVDVCARGEALNQDFPQRHAACFAEGALPRPAFDAGSCDDSMSACSPTDQSALQGYFDCVEKLPVCTAQNRTAFSEQFLACATGMGPLSEGCFRP